MKIKRRGMSYMWDSCDVWMDIISPACDPSKPTKAIVAVVARGIMNRYGKTTWRVTRDWVMTQIDNWRYDQVDMDGYAVHDSD